MWKGEGNTLAGEYYIAKLLFPILSKREKTKYTMMKCFGARKKYWNNHHIKANTDFHLFQDSGTLE